MSPKRFDENGIELIIEEEEPMEEEEYDDDEPIEPETTTIDLLKLWEDSWAVDEAERQRIMTAIMVNCNRWAPLLTVEEMERRIHERYPEAPDFYVVAVSRAMKNYWAEEVVDKCVGTEALAPPSFPSGAGPTLSIDGAPEGLPIQFDGDKKTSPIESPTGNLCSETPDNV